MAVLGSAPVHDAVKRQIVDDCPDDNAAPHEFAERRQRFATASALARIEPPDLSVEADRGLLEQAVINLVKNALDATAGQPSPRIVLACRSEPGRVTITVADNGEGVPPGRMETIFIPFFTSRAGGSGIGLSLARQITLAHGGQLTVAANTPRGAVFEISLPERADA